jgi:hypothetical protein
LWNTWGEYNKLPKLREFVGYGCNSAEVWRLFRKIDQLLNEESINAGRTQLLRHDFLLGTLAQATLASVLLAEKILGYQPTDPRGQGSEVPA